jgi:HAD superfamily hydrolase (TIGR01549 family)
VRRPPQLVLLDVDFTLIRPCRVFDAHGYAALGARFGARLDPERFERARLDAFAVWRTGTLEHRRGQHRRFAAEIVRGMGAPPALAEAIGAAAEREWGEPGNFEVFADVAPAIAALRAGGCAVGLLSNTDRDLAPFAARLGIDADFALASHAHGRRKPCETIFAAALALGGVDPEDAAMAGDNLEDDVEGARRCGLRAVLVDRGDRHPAYGGERVRSLAELPALLGVPAPAGSAAGGRGA